MTADDINRLYQQYLGRDALPEEAQGWLSGAYGATDAAGIEGQIASSGEAQARRSQAGGGPPETVPGAGPGYTVGGAVGGGGVSGDQINGWYQRYLGRAANPDEITNWQNGTYGATDAAGIEGQIASSGEAQAHGGGGGGTGGGSGTGGGYAGSGAGGATGGGGAPGDGGNYWGAGTTNNPFGPWQGRFTAPTPAALPDAPVFHAPNYTPPPAFDYDASHPAPTYTPPPAFSYGDFQPPTAAEALNDPGYQFRTQQGQDALQNAAAAKGTLADSGTLKALTDYGQGAASQEYQNVWQRDLGAYTTNRGNALDTYNTNYKTQYQDPYTAALGQYTMGRGNALDTYNTNYKTQYQDPYAYAYKAAQDAFNPQLAGYQNAVQNTTHQNDVANTNAWNDYLAGWQDYEARRNTSTNFALGS
jgi:hypothetical protein